MHPRIMKYTSDVKEDEFHSTMVTLNTHNIITLTLTLTYQT